MTSALPATSTTGNDNSSQTSSVLFLDWPDEVGSFPQATLFGDEDFSQQSVIFFDPYQFALTQKLRSKDKENSAVEYVDLGERDFLVFLKYVKSAQAKLQKFLENDGTLVIRSRIPKSHIKVRKKSTAAVRKYTESIISAFFWLDEILGRRSFNSCNSRILKYRQEDHPFAEVFGDCVVDCYQTQDVIGKGAACTIAVGGASGKAPLISRVTYLPRPGQVYFIPRFLVKDEPEKLVRVFQMLAQTDVDDFQKPAWLAYYEKQVASYSPHREQISRIDLEIEALLKQRAKLSKIDSEAEKLPGLLYERGKNLVEAVTIALTMLGFEEIRRMGELSENILTAKHGESLAERALIKIAEPGEAPTSAELVEELSEAMAAYSSKVRIKGIIIGNGCSAYPPEKRTEWFDEAAIESGQRSEFALVPTLELFVATSVALSRANTQNIERIKASLRKDLTQADGVFEINRPKYGI